MANLSPEPSFADLIQSDIFTFYIGKDKKPIEIHSGIVAATSNYFQTLVNGNILEAKTRSAEIKDIEPEDFARFVEYAYRNDYTVPKWIYDESPEPDSNEVRYMLSSNSVDFDNVILGKEGGYVPPHLRAKMKLTTAKKSRAFDENVSENSTSDLRSGFKERSYMSGGNPRRGMLKGFSAKSNSAAHQNFTPVLLAHARLYSFADMRLIHSLRNLTLHKLHRTLASFKLYEQRVGDMVQLVRWAYDNGSNRAESGELDDLRQLVVEYMACEVDTVGNHKEFKALLEEGGEFVSDFWSIVMKYRIRVLS
ncbi:hypothetical protein GQ44DRAFT_791088 [Phaeosphaeriaceae sp. PMI808]|nr:hypothetical protein GQ44DRAFT_791088 [Phaeosphaeriaceae sp. PMI808]